MSLLPVYNSHILWGQSLTLLKAILLLLILMVGLGTFIFYNIGVGITRLWSISKHESSNGVIGALGPLINIIRLLLVVAELYDGVGFEIFRHIASYISLSHILYLINRVHHFELVSFSLLKRQLKLLLVSAALLRL